MIRKRMIFALMTVLGCVAGGCSSSTAAVDLITQARRGLALARQAELESYQRMEAATQQQLRSLDAAFDADVRLVEAGQLMDSDGQPISLSADWVIEARQGYAAARSLIQTQLQEDAGAHAVRLDNLAASDEALDLAGQLIVLQWNLAEQFKQKFMELQNQFLGQEETTNAE